jgi:nicotinamidase-related amidase
MMLENNPAIYRTMKEITEPAHTLLVVWDVQDLLVGRIFNREEFLLNIKTVIAAARSRNVPIVYSRITPFPPQYASSWQIYMNLRRSHLDDPRKLPLMKPGSIELEINDQVRPLEDDLVLNKYTPSIFNGTPFEMLLRNRGVKTILLTGISTEMGIDSSAREASNRGFYTIVLEDCVSSPDKEAHQTVLKVLAKICLVVPSGDIIKAWE